MTQTTETAGGSDATAMTTAAVIVAAPTALAASGPVRVDLGAVSCPAA